MLVTLFTAAVVLSLLYWTAGLAGFAARFFRTPVPSPHPTPPPPVGGGRAERLGTQAGRRRRRLLREFRQLLPSRLSGLRNTLRRRRRRRPGRGDRAGIQADFPERKVRLVEVTSGAGNPKCDSLHQLASAGRGRSPGDERRRRFRGAGVFTPRGRPSAGPRRRGRDLSLPHPAGRFFAVVSGGEYFNSEFVPSAIFAHQTLGVLVGLGATIAVRRRDLGRAGGYAAIADYLTDDYQVVERISRLGLRVGLCNYVVTHVLGDAGFRDQWDREVRWAMGVRTCSPCGYPGLLLTYTSPLALALAAATGFSAAGTAMLAAALFLRLLLAWRMQVLLCGRPNRGRLLWLPIREFVSLLRFGRSQAADRGGGSLWRGVACSA